MHKRFTAGSVYWPPQPLLATPLNGNGSKMKTKQTVFHMTLQIVLTMTTFMTLKRSKRLKRSWERQTVAAFVTSSAQHHLSKRMMIVRVLLGFFKVFGITLNNLTTKHLNGLDEYFWVIRNQIAVKWSHVYWKVTYPRMSLDISIW